MGIGDWGLAQSPIPKLKINIIKFTLKTKIKF